MPLRHSAKHNDTLTALCLNCDDEVLNMPIARFTLSADDDFGEPEPIRLFIASCNACGYTEFYRDGFLFKSDKEDT